MDRKQYKKVHYPFTIPKNPKKDSKNHNREDQQHKKLMDILEERKFKAMSKDWLDE